MKRFALKILLIVPLLSCIAVVNFYVDSAHLFRDQDYLNKLATHLIDGKSVTNVGNYDERRLQKVYINQLEKAHDVIALGSSRILQLNRSLFASKRFFNHGVSGAVLQDYLSIYQLYESAELLPKKVVLGLDPWILNKQNGENRWMSLNDECNLMLRKLELENLQFEISNQYGKSKIRELFNPAYFMESIRHFNDELVVVETQDVEGRILRSDGMREYSSDEKMLSSVKVEERALVYANRNKIPQLCNYEVLDEDLALMLGSLIKHLLEDDVEVEVFLTPFHPTAYEILMSRQDYRILQVVEAYFKDLAKSCDITLKGSYNPLNLGLTKSDFHDALHPKREAIEKIFLRN